MPSRLNSFALSDNGAGKPPILFLHGYGCDQGVWRLVAPHFEAQHRIILYDQMGCGSSVFGESDPSKYDRLDGYARDLVSICDKLDLNDLIVIGHSASAMIALLASLSTRRISRLVLVGASPCYHNDGDYRGGFEHDELLEVLDALEMDHLGWVRAMAPNLGGVAAADLVQAELSYGFSKANPEIIRRFARATFLSDYRDILTQCTAQTLVLQCHDDPVAPETVGAFTAATIENARFAVLETSGHFPQLSAPNLLIDAVEAFIGEAKTQA